MASVSSALRRIKDDLSAFLPERAIVAACRKAGHQWRQRKLGPVETIHLFILQILNFNTAMTGLRHLSKTALNASAYCKARMRLPLKVLQALLVESSAAMRKTAGPPALWCGLKAYLVDGSSTIAPDTPDAQKAFGQPKVQKPGCGFPMPKVLGLFDAFSGLIVQVMGLPLYTHEQSKVWLLHPLLGAGDLLVGDRGGSPPMNRRGPLLFLRSSGDAVDAGHSRAFSHASGADRGLPPAPQASTQVSQGQESHGQTHAAQPLRRTAGPLGSARRVVQARARQQAEVDEQKAIRLAA